MQGMQGLNVDMLKSMLAAQAGEAALSILAGRCFSKTVDGEMWITSDKRQGQIDLAKDPQEQLWHFKWKNIMSGKVDLNLTIFPGSAKWYKLDYVEDGEVYELRIGPSKHWFWIQEKPGDDEKKKEALKESYKKLRNILTHGSVDNPNDKKDDKKDGTSGSQQQQTGASAVPGVGAGTGGAAVPSTMDIMKALQSVVTNAQEQSKPDIFIGDLFEGKTMDKVLEDPEAVKELLEKGHDKLSGVEEEKEQIELLRSDLLSPQVQGSCKVLSRVIRSGHAKSLLSELKIDKPVTTVKQFLEAIAGEEFGELPKEDEEMKTAEPSETAEQKEPAPDPKAMDEDPKS